MFLTILCACRTINKPPHIASPTTISHIQPHLISLPKPPHPISNPILPCTHNCHLAHGAYTHPLACIFRPVFHCYLSAGNYRRYTEDIQKIYRRYTEDTRRIHEGYTEDNRIKVMSFPCHSIPSRFPRPPRSSRSPRSPRSSSPPRHLSAKKKTSGTAIPDAEIQTMSVALRGLSIHPYGSFKPPL